jgi:NMD protein affecting ribosome stability and mRNA decay
MYEEHVHDSYRTRGKYPEPTICPECRALFHHGRWQWGEAIEGAQRHLCPACQRIRDRLPAAQLTLSGPFFVEHRHEIMGLVHHTESRAKAEHPLERIMDISEDAETCVIRFTEAHLAHGVGAAVHHAYKGELKSVYTDEDALFRISWSR